MTATIIILVPLATALNAPILPVTLSPYHFKRTISYAELATHAALATLPACAIALLCLFSENSFVLYSG